MVHQPITVSSTTMIDPPAIPFEKVCLRQKHSCNSAFKKAKSSHYAESTLYSIGDEAKDGDMAVYHDPIEHITQVSRLAKNDHAFIRRLGGRFTFALVLSHELHGQEHVIELEVNEEGATKSIPKSHWPKYIRLLKSMKRDSPPSLQPSRSRLSRRASTGMACGSTTNNTQTRSAILNKQSNSTSNRRSSLSSRIQTSPKIQPQLKPALNRGSSFRSCLHTIPPSPPPSLKSAFNRQPSLKNSSNSNNPCDEPRRVSWSEESSALCSPHSDSSEISGLDLDEPRDEAMIQMFIAPSRLHHAKVQFSEDSLLSAFATIRNK